MLHMYLHANRRHARCVGGNFEHNSKRDRLNYKVHVKVTAGGDYVPRLILTSLIVSLMTEGSKDDGFKMDETHRGETG